MGALLDNFHLNFLYIKGSGVPTFMSLLNLELTGLCHALDL